MSLLTRKLVRDSGQRSRNEENLRLRARHTLRHALFDWYRYSLVDELTLYELASDGVPYV